MNDLDFRKILLEEIVEHTTSAEKAAFCVIDAGTCSTPRRFLFGAFYFFTCKKRKP